MSDQQERIATLRDRARWPDDPPDPRELAERQREADGWERASAVGERLQRILAARRQVYQEHEGEVEKARQEFLASRAAAMERERDEHLRRCHVPEVCRSIYRGDLKRTGPFRLGMESVQRWIASASPVCILVGSLGRGKTVAAVQLLLEAKRWTQSAVHSFGDPVRHQVWDSADALFITPERLRTAPWTDGRCALLDRATDCRFLVLDEAGKDGASDNWQTRRQDLLSYRLESGRKTVITCNLEARQKLGDWFGASLADRMRVAAEVIELNGPSFRQRGGLSVVPPEPKG